MTATHSLQLSTGLLRVTVTEAPAVVYVWIAGARLRMDEREKFAAFLRPLIDAYRDDARRIEISGQHARFTGHVDPVGAGDWMAYTKAAPEARQ